MAKVTVIPQTINPITQSPIGSIKKRRVCAYARVSTDSDEQFTSFEAQVNYYSTYIKSKPDWEFVEVYADEGITGTSTKKRTNFKRMIADALEGKIDLIITKSISRFARNTLDTISITRELKAKGVEVFFEKENLWTLDPKNELVLTIMAGISEAESQTISQNVTLGKRWAMQEGKVSFAYSNFLGYKKENGKIVIDEEQAKIVRYIYYLFLVKGKTTTTIAQMLKEEGILTPSGRSTNWTANRVLAILTNEKYKGDALLQKTYIVDFLEHKPKKNNGKLTQYYVENSHPAIIDKDEWQMVQTEIARRKKIGLNYSGKGAFSSKLICRECGGFYGSKVWHSTSKFKKVIFQCNNKFKDKEHKCRTPHLMEEEIKSLFIKAYNLAFTEKDRILEDTKEVIELLTSTKELDAKILEITNEISIIASMVQKLIDDNSRRSQDQDEYWKKYNALKEKYDDLKNQLDELQKEKAYKKGQALNLEIFLRTFEKADGVLQEWDEELWMLTIETAVVSWDKSITFKFYNGIEITVK